MSMLTTLYGITNSSPSDDVSLIGCVGLMLVAVAWPASLLSSCWSTAASARSFISLLASLVVLVGSTEGAGDAIGSKEVEAVDNLLRNASGINNV